MSKIDIIKNISQAVIEYLENNKHKDMYLFIPLFTKLYLWENFEINVSFNIGLCEINKGYVKRAWNTYNKQIIDLVGYYMEDDVDCLVLNETVKKGSIKGKYYVNTEDCKEFTSMMDEIKTNYLLLSATSQENTEIYDFANKAIEEENKLNKWKEILPNRIREVRRYINDNFKSEYQTLSTYLNNAMKEIQLKKIFEHLDLFTNFAFFNLLKDIDIFMKKISFIAMDDITIEHLPINLLTNYIDIYEKEINGNDLDNLCIYLYKYQGINNNRFVNKTIDRISKEEPQKLL